MTRALWTVGVLMLGCMPPLHSIAGSACNADHPCPSPFVCNSANVCVEGAGAGGGGGGAVVVAFKDDFEAGVANWDSPVGSRTQASMVQKNGGMSSMRTTAPESATSIRLETLRDVVLAGTGRYCARAFVRNGMAAPAAIRMQLRTYGGAAGMTLLAQSDLAAPGASATSPTSFSLVKAELDVDATTAQVVTVLIECGSPSPAEIFVDDVLVERRSGSCD